MNDCLRPTASRTIVTRRNFMAYYHHDTPRTHTRTTSATETYYSATLSPRHSMVPAPSRPSMSSDRGLPVAQVNSPTSKLKKRMSTRNETDHRSIMSSRASETSQATRTSRIRKRDRAPLPPPKDMKFTSFTPAMTEEEDARSEMLALKSKIRTGLSRLMKACLPRMHKPHKSQNPSESSSPNYSFESSEVSRHSRW